jgi:hypothetical protein
MQSNSQENNSYTNIYLTNNNTNSNNDQSLIDQMRQNEKTKRLGLSKAKLGALFVIAVISFSISPFLFGSSQAPIIVELPQTGESQSYKEIFVGYDGKLELEYNYKDIMIAQDTSGAIILVSKNDANSYSKIYLPENNTESIEQIYIDKLTGFQSKYNNVQVISEDKNFVDEIYILTLLSYQDEASNGNVLLIITQKMGRIVIMETILSSDYTLDSIENYINIMNNIQLNY